MTMESLQNADDKKQLFSYIERWVPRDVFEEGELKQQKHDLRVLNLKTSSTAADARRVAISLRAKMRNDGLNVETVKALQWALKKTNDCDDEYEFLRFLLGDTTFSRIVTDRMDFR